MAISDLDDDAVSAEVSSRSDLDLKNRSLRRRTGAGDRGATEKAARDSPDDQDSASAESLTKVKHGDGSGDGAPAPAEERSGGLDDRDLENLAAKLQYRPAAPAHRKVRESCLSSNTIFKQSHGGLFNLCIVVLVAVNSRLIIENLLKYGLLIRSGFWFGSTSIRDWPLLLCCLTLPEFALIAFAIEKLVENKYISETIAVCLHVILTTTIIVLPVYLIYKCDSAVLSGVALMLLSCIVWSKLVSYAHTNFDRRALLRSVLKGEIEASSLIAEYSCNVSFGSLTYFMVAPTLCYQPMYPRTKQIRKGWVFRQVLILITFTGVMGFIVEQYINPIVQNSQHPLKGDFLYAIERVLKLSVPNLYVWLCMFYCFFHIWLNILAELLRFGDREFYKDWWNAKTVEEYWKLWNMPVHKWMVRHVFIPCMERGLNKEAAIFVVFLISAVFHELCIAVPCHIFKFWAFVGIMFQVPLVILTRYLQSKFRNSMVGNMLFWFFFCILGQPMCLLLYYHDVMNQQGKPA